MDTSNWCEKFEYGRGFDTKFEYKDAAAEVPMNLDCEVPPLERRTDLYELLIRVV